MKKVRQLSQTLAVVSFVLALISIIVTKGLNETIVLVQSVMVTGAIPLVLATAFVFSKNSIVEKVGYGLIALMASMGLSGIINSGIKLDSFSKILDLVIVILQTVSVLAFFVKAVLEYFGYSKELFSSLGNSKVAILKRWNKLVTSNTITSEDYNEVKKHVLKLESNSSKSIELDELRELLENNLAGAKDLRELLATLA